MTIIQRRVFYGKVGAADELISWANEMYSLIKESNPTVKFRVMSDYQSGRTDRVVSEIEVDSLASLESMLDDTMADEATGKKFESIFGRLGALIDHAEVEQWVVHE
jgi:hypothetical protein